MTDLAISSTVRPEPVTYRWLAAELVGGALLADLPLRVESFGSVLDGAGTIRASLKLLPIFGWQHDPANLLVDGEPLVVDGEPVTVGPSVLARRVEQNRVWKDATSPAKRVVYAVRNRTIAGAWVWWKRTYDPESQTMSLEGAELWSLLRRRRVTWSASYGLQDQLDIARDIITRAMAAAGGDLGLTLDAEDSGRPRDRSYFDYEAKPVAEAVEQLAGVIDGFDFAVTARFEDGAVVRDLELDYPRRGRTAAVSGHVFEWGRNVVAMGWSEDASRMANSIIGLGQGEGLSKVRTRVTDTSAFAEGYPLLEDSISLGDVSDLDTLDGHVRAELAQRSRPVTLPTVTVRGDSDPPVGAYQTGDDAHFVVPAGVDPFWPDGLNDPRRIHEITVHPPNDGGVELVDLVLGEATAGV